MPDSLAFVTRATPTHNIDLYNCNDDINNISILKLASKPLLFIHKGFNSCKLLLCMHKVTGIKILLLKWRNLNLVIHLLLGPDLFLPGH